MRRRPFSRWADGVTTDAFTNHLMAWTRAACTEWGWREPGHDYYERIANRLPEGLRTLLANGIEQGLIIPRGRANGSWSMSRSRSARARSRRS